MNAPTLYVNSFFKLLCQLASAHGLAQPESPDEVREFAFTPGGVSYRLMPQPQDGTQALLEIDITRLDTQFDNTPTSPALEQLLRTLLQLNPVLEDKNQWLISLDDEDVLVLSTPVSLMSSAEAVQMLALDGLQRARFLALATHQ
jgi:hypothetical protein